MSYFEGITSFLIPPSGSAFWFLWPVAVLLVLGYAHKFARNVWFGVGIVVVATLLYLNSYFHDLVVFDPSSPIFFTKFSFWFLFALVLGIDALIYTKKPLRSLFLFFVSLFFYHKTSGLFFLLLLLTIHMDYGIGLLLGRLKDETLRKALMIFSVTINLGILCYFKYAYFFTESYNSLFNGKLEVVNHLAVFGNGFFGQDWFRVDKIILPIGISFYTFQTISYVVEVYKRNMEPVRNLCDYGFYLSFFPQVLSGPITRATEFIPQIYKPYSLTKLEFGTGLFWILNGLVKKIFIGDYIAINFIDRIYANPTMYTGLENFLAVMAYSLQVYCDFSGYTDIATGVALLMGFHLAKNFNSPYKAEDVGDFWRRWHISLSTWLRDYLYIPLGGNRKATVGTFFWLVLIGTLIAMLAYTYFKVDFPENPSIQISIGTIIFPLCLLGIVLVLLIAAKFKDRTNPNTLLISIFGISLLMFSAFLKMGPLDSGSTLKAGDIVVYAAMGLLALFAPCALFIYLFGRRFEKVKSAVTTEINMMLTMLIGGLWHGASWMFIIWGGLNGLGLVVFKRWKKISPFTNVNTKLVRIWGIASTLVFISLTRIFFRSPDLDVAKSVINQMVYNFSPHLFWDIMVAYKYVFSVTAIGFIFHWLPSDWKNIYRERFAKLPTAAMAGVCVMVVIFLYQVSTGELQKFIYFQF